MSFPQSDCLDDCLHVPYIRYTWCSALSLFDWSFRSFFSSLRHLCDFSLLRASRFPLDMRGERFAKDRLLPCTFVSNPKICSKRRFGALFGSFTPVRLIHQQGNPVIVTALHQKALAYIRSRIEDCHGDVELFVACSWEKLRAGHGHTGSVLHRSMTDSLPDSVGTAFNGLHRSNWHRTSDIGSRAGGLSGRVSQLHIAGTLVARCWCCFAGNVGCFSFD
jgi:hypothetical protein